MIVKKIEVIRVQLPFLAPFEVSFGRLPDKHALIIKLYTDDLVAYGECTAFQGPWYNPETVWTAMHIIRDHIAPRVLNQDIKSPEDLMERLAFIRGNRMAIAAVEMAWWDLEMRAQKKSLKTLLGGTQNEIPAGASIGIQDTVQILLDKIKIHLDQGYRKIKVKIKPGWDVDVLREIRRVFPNAPLMADANSAYRLEDIDLFKAMDEFNLIMIEQPLAEDDIIDHVKLQRVLKTPICLDESIESCEDARKAIELGACRIINVKPPRVGGLLEAKKIHDLCQKNGIPVWCGGIFELGIGRVQNIALASLPNFTIPGDLSPSKRYFKEDITIPRVDVNERCMIEVPDEKNGIVYEIDDAAIARITKEQFTIA
jgi:O-succinylbenzoate synthase